MTDEPNTPESAPKAMVAATVTVVIVLPSLVGAIIGAVIGYPVNDGSRARSRQTCSQGWPASSSGPLRIG
jgi:hypothetical protein